MFNPRRRSYKRNYIIGIIAVILIYLVLSARYQSYEHQDVVKNTNPIVIWEFIADFSKMKELNPTILDFKVLSDHGNYDDWKYSVEYREKLSHWPYWHNKIVGNFHVKKTIVDQITIYIVESMHKVCFFRFLCLKSTGEFQIKQLNDNDTQVIETVNYQCPPFVSQFCQKEVEYQRKKIMQNLIYHFTQKNKQRENI